MPFALVLSNVQDGMLGESTAIACVKVVVGVVANKVIGCYWAGGKMLGHGRGSYFWVSDLFATACRVTVFT